MFFGGGGGGGGGGYQLKRLGMLVEKIELNL